MPPAALPRFTRLPLLDALRTLAALGVAGFHLVERFGAPGRLGPLSRGYLFVDLFFILSGFVLARAYEPRLRTGLGTWGFVAIRIRRLWPLVALGAVAGAATFVPYTPVGQVLGLLVMALVMVPVMNPAMALYPLNGPQWSLLWELAANGLHAALLVRLGGRGLAAVLVLSGALLAMAIGWAGSCRFGPNAMWWWLAAPRVMWSYTLGVALARGLDGRIGRGGLDWRLALALPVLAVGVLGMIPQRSEAWGDGCMVVVVWPVLFAAAVMARVPQPAERWLARAGLLSFPLYALHLPVMLAVWFVAPGALGEGVAALAVVAMASLVAFWLEARKPRAVPYPKLAQKGAKSCDAIKLIAL